MSQNSPRYILAATPLPGEDADGRSPLRDFYSLDKGPATLIERPPETRWASFGLSAGGKAELVEGKYVEARSVDRKRLRVYIDGTVIFSATADSEFLGWPNEPEEFEKNPRVNPVVVVDSAMSFVRFLKALLPYFDRMPKMFNVRVELRNAVVHGNPMYLIEGELNDRWRLDEPLDRHYVTGPNPKRESLLSTRRLLEENPSDPTLYVDMAAFAVAAAFYSLFGLGEHAVPYTEQAGSGRRISLKRYDRPGY